MKKLFLALIAVATIALTGCENPKNEPNPPENGDNTIICSCTCRNRYEFTQSSARQIALIGQSDYKVYASGFSSAFTLILGRVGHPFVTYKETLRGEGYYFWRCACGRYHQISLYNLTHTEIPDGQQPEEWNQFNYLWE